MTSQQADTGGRLSGVGSTALGVALARAEESARPDRLFDDPYAADFVRESGHEQDLWHTPQSQGLREAMGDYFALRTRFFDDYLLAATAAGCPQVVLIASGLDTRAHRLAWPEDVRVFEVDRPDVLDFKEPVLRARGDEPGCDRTVVYADLREGLREPLLRHGFRPDVPTAWLVEGLLVYLTEEENAALLTEVGELSAPGSRLGVEHVSKPMLETDRTKEALAESERAAGGGEEGEEGSLTLLASLWRNESAEDPAAWLGRYGWPARAYDLVQLAEDAGRPVPLAFDPSLPGTARTGLLLAARD